MKYRWVNKVTKVNKRIKKGPSSSFVKFFGSSSRNRLVLKIIKIQPGLLHFNREGWFDQTFSKPWHCKKEDLSDPWPMQKLLVDLLVYNIVQHYMYYLNFANDHNFKIVAKPTLISKRSSTVSVFMSSSWMNVWFTNPCLFACS